MSSAWIREALQESLMAELRDALAELKAAVIDHDHGPCDDFCDHADCDQMRRALERTDKVLGRG